MDKLKKSGYGYSELELAWNSDVLEKRTIEEQLKLMDKLKECEYNDNALQLALDRDVLEKRTIEEQLKLMDKLKECKYHDNALGLVIDPDLLERQIEEQLMQMSGISKNRTKTYADILTSAHSKKELKKFLTRIKAESGNIDFSLSDKVNFGKSPKKYTNK